MAAPPLLAGGVKATLAWAMLADARPMVGAPGTVVAGADGPSDAQPAVMTTAAIKRLVRGRREIIPVISPRRL